MIRKTIVIEIGSTYIRCGFSGDETPRFTFKSNIINHERECQESLIVRLTDLLQRIFLEKLQVKSKEFSVIIVEKLLSAKLLRDTLLTILLKDFQVIINLFNPYVLLGFCSFLSS